VLYMVVSLVLMLCVPVLGLLALCVSIRLCQTLNHADVNAVDRRQLVSREKTVFCLVFVASVCLRNFLTLSHCLRPL